MVTVALKQTTYDLLSQVKEDIQAETFDEAVKKLVISAKKPKRSFFGRFKDLPEFKREELDRFD